MKEISLALGGGGVRGAAHVGVIRRLEKDGYQIKAISGTSAGGIVGAVYAAGFSTDEIEQFLIELTKSKLFGHNRTDGPALLGLQGFAHHLSNFIGDRTFNDLRIPFACVAVDIKSHQEIIIKDGRLIDAIMATIAVPGIFPPQYFGNAILVDGGVFDPVPVALARWLAPALPVLAVCLSPALEDFSRLPELHLPSETPIPASILNQLIKLPMGQALKLFLESTEATACMLADLRLKADKPDIIIRPELADISLLDHIDPLDLIHRGEKAVEMKLPEMERKLSWLRRISRQFIHATPPGNVLNVTTSPHHET